MPTVPKRIHAGGTIMALALTPKEQLSLLIRKDDGSGSVLCVDSDGVTSWHVDLPFSCDRQVSPRRSMRVANDGSTWIAEGRTLTCFGPDGKAQAGIEIPSEVDGELGSFLLVPDGFIAALHQPAARNNAGNTGRVVHLNARGHAMWSAVISAGAMAY